MLVALEPLLELGDTVVFPLRALRALGAWTVAFLTDLPPTLVLAPLISGVGDFDRFPNIVGLMSAESSSSEELTGEAERLVCFCAKSLDGSFNGSFLAGIVRPEDLVRMSLGLVLGIMGRLRDCRS